MAASVPNLIMKTAAFAPVCYIRKATKITDLFEVVWNPSLISWRVLKFSHKNTEQHFMAASRIELRTSNVTGSLLQRAEICTRVTFKVAQRQHSA
jgi:hypothetical protein